MGSDFSTTGSAIAPLASGQAQYLIKVSLVVGNAGSSALDLSALQIRFTVTCATAQTPRRMDARIYNLSDATVKTIQDQFTYVQLSAGFQDGPFGPIFSGTICQTRRGRESAVDSYLDIAAADGDIPYNQSVVNVTLAPGWKPADQLKALLDSMKGISLGIAPTLDTTEAPRAKVMYGPTRDHLRAFGKANGLEWNLENDKLNLVAWLGYIPGEAIVLTAATGMLGVPEQTIDGVNVRCLLNPNVKTGRLLKIDNASIANTKFTQQIGLDVTRLPDLDCDGMYKVYSLRHEGDTRGSVWFTEAICEAQNATVKNIQVSSEPYKSRVVNGQ